MNHDDRDELWELMGRARPRKPSPAFVQNVLRAVRMSEPEREIGFAEWLRSGWNWLAMAGAAAVVLFVAIGTDHPSQTAPTLAAHGSAVADESLLQSSDFAVVTNLDLLLALDDKNPWLESSLP